MQSRLIAGVSSLPPTRGNPRPVDSHSNETSAIFAIAIKFAALGDVPRGRSHCTAALALTPTLRASCARLRPKASRERLIRSGKSGEE